MKSINPVKMLVAFALVLLVSSVTEGRIIHKCELKAKLDAARFQQITVMEETITANSLITRLVCKADRLAFNTSSVKNIMVHNKEMNPSQDPPPPRARRAPPQAPLQAAPSGAPPKAPQSRAALQAAPRRGPPQAPSSGAPPQAPAGAPPKAPQSRAALQAAPRRGPPQASSSGAPPQASSSGAPPKAPLSRVALQAAPPKPTEGPQQPQLTTAARVVGHLYGVFQLSDQLACNSGMMPSLNICNMTCFDLIDDDITDDIACLKTLMNSMKEKPKEIPTDVEKNVEMLVKECHVSPDYFAECV